MELRYWLVHEKQLNKLVEWKAFVDNVWITEERKTLEQIFQIGTINLEMIDNVKGAFQFSQLFVTFESALSKVFVSFVSAFSIVLE